MFFCRRGAYLGLTSEHDGRRTELDATGGYQGLDVRGHSATFLGMNRVMEDVARNATQLPRQQRLPLARFLLELDAAPSTEAVDNDWDTEIRDRVQAVQTGQAKALPYAEVLARIDQRFGP